jgi:hypothetical protein
LRFENFRYGGDGLWPASDVKTAEFHDNIWYNIELRASIDWVYTKVTNDAGQVLYENATPDLKGEYLYYSGYGFALLCQPADAANCDMSPGSQYYGTYYEVDFTDIQIDWKYDWEF